MLPPEVAVAVDVALLGSLRKRVRLVGECLVLTGAGPLPWETAPTWNGGFVGQPVAVCGTQRCVRPSHVEFVWRVATDLDRVRSGLPVAVRVSATPSPRPWPAPPSPAVAMRARRSTSANAAKTCCPAGHPYDGPNTRVTRAGRRVCKACERRREEAKRAGTWVGALPNGQKTTCPAGHPYDMTDERGYRRCSVCRREQANARRRQKADAARGEGRAA